MFHLLENVIHSYKFRIVSKEKDEWVNGRGATAVEVGQNTQPRTSKIVADRRIFENESINIS